jgi:hypothetical protein
MPKKRQTAGTEKTSRQQACPVLCPAAVFGQQAAEEQRQVGEELRQTAEQLRATAAQHREEVTGQTAAAVACQAAAHEQW